MDRVEQYRGIVKNLIRQYATYKPSYGDIEVETVLDDQTDHYELVYTGWNGSRRVDGAVIHVDIRNGKVWVQHDGTGDGIVDDLLEAGVPPEHIVLAWQPPDVRSHTEFAVA